LIGVKIEKSGFWDKLYLKANGLDPNSFHYGDQDQQPQFKGMAILDGLLGASNFTIPYDYVISMKSDSLKFAIEGKIFDFSGHYAVMLIDLCII